MNGWHWEAIPSWYYTILEPADDPVDVAFNVVTRSSDWRWNQLVSDFVGNHNPASLMQFVGDVFKPLSSTKLEVTINLLDQRPYWKRICQQALVHAIKLPRAYTGTIKNGLPLIVDTDASVSITPQREDFIFYRDSIVKIKDLSKPNTGAGESVVCWEVKDTSGKIVNLNLPGYHISNAEV